MNAKKWTFFVIACLALMWSPVAASHDYTVGDFAVDLATMITNGAQYGPEEASVLLQELGLGIDHDLDATLDESRLVESLNSLGTSLTTTNPSREVTSDLAGRVFRMFQTNDAFFSGEAIRTCQVEGDDANGPRPCVTDADCNGNGKCKIVQSIQCHGGPNQGDSCYNDGDCPDGTCNIPPGQLKKILIASPVD